MVRAFWHFIQQQKTNNLESTTPAFLRRLRGEIPSGPSGSSTDPDRHAIPQVRARRPRDPAEEDDGPVYVDAGTGQTLSLGEIDELKEGSGVKKDVLEEETKDGVDGTKEVLMEERAVVKAAMHVGHSRRKREVPVVVRKDGNDDAEEGERSDGGTNKRSASRDVKEKGSKVKRKTKKVKLSFDND